MDMSETGSAQGRDVDRAPVGVRAALWISVGAVLAGALYLVAVRGEALIVDLSALSGRIFCL